MEFVGEKFPELIEEEKASFNYGDTYYCVLSAAKRSVADLTLKLLNFGIVNLSIALNVGN